MAWFVAGMNTCFHGIGCFGSSCLTNMLEGSGPFLEPGLSGLEGLAIEV